MTVGKFQMETNTKWRERESAGRSEEEGGEKRRIKKK